MTRSILTEIDIDVSPTCSPCSPCHATEDGNAASEGGRECWEAAWDEATIADGIARRGGGAIGHDDEPPPPTTTNPSSSSSQPRSRRSGGGLMQAIADHAPVEERLALTALFWPQTLVCAS
jgi:hypothetical protein